MLDSKNESMDIGVMGINKFAMTFCKHWVLAGHKIMFTDLPGRLENYHKISKLGPGVSATTPDQIGILTEIVVLAIDYNNLEESIKLIGPLRQKIVVDLVGATTNHGNSFFEIQEMLPEVKVVRLTYEYPHYLHHSAQYDQVIFSYSNDQLAQRMVRWSIEGSGYPMIDVDNDKPMAVKRNAN